MFTIALNHAISKDYIRTHAVIYTIFVKIKNVEYIQIMMSYKSNKIAYYVKQTSCAHYHYLFYGIFLHTITIIIANLVVTSNGDIYMIYVLCAMAY